MYTISAYLLSFLPATFISPFFSLITAPTRLPHSSSTPTPLLLIIRLRLFLVVFYSSSHHSSPPFLPATLLLCHPSCRSPPRFPPPLPLISLSASPFLAPLRLLSPYLIFPCFLFVIFLRSSVFIPILSAPFLSFPFFFFPGLSLIFFRF